MVACGIALSEGRARDAAPVLPEGQSKIGGIWGWEEDGEKEDDPYGRTHKDGAQVRLFREEKEEEEEEEEEEELQGRRETTATVTTKDDDATNVALQAQMVLSPVKNYHNYSK